MRNEDIPIGFTMELAQHENALSAFSSLTSDQQRQVIDGATGLFIFLSLFYKLKTFHHIVNLDLIVPIPCESHRKPSN